MCVYSMVVDQGMKDLQPFIQPPDFSDTIRDNRIAELERKVEALEEMLKAAKIYDEAFEQPDCELESKKQQLTDLADQLGVEINFP